MRVARSLLAFWFVFLAFLVLPAFPVADSHDLGSQAAMEFWAQREVRFGTDINQNVGPYGFIVYPGVFTGILDTLKISLVALLVAAVSFFSVLELKRCGLKLAALVLLVFAFSKSSSHESLLYLLAVSSLVAIIETESWLLSSLAVLTLSLLAGSKGTFAAIWLATVAMLVLLSAISKDKKRALQAFGLIGAFLLSWLTIGQRVEDIPAYFFGIVSFVSGYSDAMSLVEPARVGIFGALALALLVVGCSTKFLLDVRRSKRRAIPLAILFSELVVGFAAWKHGFVRADSHVFFFFGYVLLFFLVGPGLRLLAAVDQPWWARAVFLLAFFTTKIGDREAIQAFQLRAPSNITHVRRNLKVLMRWDSHLAFLRDSLGSNVAPMVDPSLGSLAGTSPIAYLGMRPASLIYGNLNVRFSPSTISFAAWNDWIARRDFDFFKDPELKLVVFSPETIDERFLPQDSSLAKLELMMNFEPAGGKDGDFYLQRKSKRSFALSAAGVHEVGLNREFELPISRRHEMQWLSLDITPTIGEVIASVLYKPNVYGMKVRFSDGSQGEFRMVKNMARIGFLVDPALVSASDWHSYYAGQTTRSVRGLSIVCQSVISPCASQFRIELSTVIVTAGVDSEP